jgi:hypothetical protein
MVYLTGVDPKEERDQQRAKLCEAVARNLEIHTQVDQKMRKTKSVLGALMRYLDVQQLEAAKRELRK